MVMQRSREIDELLRRLSDTEITALKVKGYEARVQDQDDLIAQLRARNNEL